MDSVWYDFRQSDQLRDEAPGAYTDIRAVAQGPKGLGQGGSSAAAGPKLQGT